ncbi:MAG: DegV family protein [Intrasporangium sp.]|uniref:DegV family protein n=1 Tax=Intrasporangium sp. TaxID=1925024 RepID=UPI003F808307
MSVRIVTDSTAYLPADLVREHGIHVVPLHVVVGGDELVEGADITAQEVAAALRQYTIVTTSRPAPEVFRETYRRLADEGATAIVSVHLSGQMSGTVEAARIAAADAPVPVEVVDSETIGMAMGYAAVSGSRVAAAGAGLREVRTAIDARLEPSGILFYVHTLEHLRRGGRIGAASALLGSALAIKPILAVRGGRIVPVEKVRTAARAIARIEALVVEKVRAGGLAVDLAVHHLDAGERAEQVAERLRTSVPEAREVRVVELGAVVGAHVGPSTLAIAVSPRPDEPAGCEPQDAGGNATVEDEP